MALMARGGAGARSERRGGRGAGAREYGIALSRGGGRANRAHPHTAMNMTQDLGQDLALST